MVSDKISDEKIYRKNKEALFSIQFWVAMNWKLLLSMKEMFNWNIYSSFSKWDFDFICTQ